MDKKPNPSELSYLLYYAMTRRTKLLKVGLFLEKKVVSDYSHNRTGNLLVSLDIVKGLIEKCSDNLDAFALNLLVIFKHMLMTKDLAICQYLSPIWHLFCSEIKADIFNGDLEFINKFKTVCQMMVDFGRNAKGPNELEWTVFSLENVQNFSPTLLYNNSITEVLVNNSMPLILDNIYKAEKDLQLDQIDSLELRKISTLKTHITRSHSLPLLEQVSLQLYKALNSLFDTTSNSTGNQLQNSSTALIEYLVVHKLPQSWADKIIQLSVNWIPVSSRFRFLDSLFKKLITTSDKSQKLLLTQQVSGLLSSPVTLISLDVPGTLKLLCREQLLLMGSQDTSLVKSYQTCIKSLTQHLYYRNQISDIVSGLLKECLDVLDNYSLKERYQDHILVLFDDVQVILDRLHVEASETLSLEIWEDSFNFIFINNTQISNRYTKLLMLFLNLDFKVQDNYQVANFNKYITNQFSPLQTFFQSLNEFLNSETRPDFVINNLVAVMVKLINRYGINTIVNGLSFFFQWQLQNSDSGDTVTQRDVLKDTVLLIFILESSELLNLSKLKTKVLAVYNYKLRSDLIYQTDYKFPQVDVKPDQDTVITRELILESVPEQSILLSWLEIDSSEANVSKQSSFFQNKTTPSPSITTPVTTNLNEPTINRSFTPISNYHQKASPRVVDLKNVLTDGNFRINLREGFTSSLVSSRIIDDVGSLLADLDLNGELSSDEEGNYTKGRLVN